jgi:hypothetical protein
MANSTQAFESLVIGQSPPFALVSRGPIAFFLAASKAIGAQRVINDNRRSVVRALAHSTTDFLEVSRT